MKIILAITCIIILTSCGINEIEFDKKTWNEKIDMFYLNRERMVNDLIDNHLGQEMSYNEIIELLGEPEIKLGLHSNSISYELIVEYGWDIDPTGGKDLLISFSEDSTIINYELLVY